MLSSTPKTQSFGLSDIYLARSRLKAKILRTPLIFSPALSQRANCQIYLKMECWQLCGSFKVRGAINMVSALSEKERSRGLVTASSGNHGTALAYAASIYGKPPTKVFLPNYADPNKVKKIKSFGAEAFLHGDTFLETLDKAQQYAKETGGTYVHSHSHPLIIAGQGTIGLEIMEDLLDIQTILVPIGGGGLISGVATAIKNVSSSVRVVGVEPTAAPGAYLSYRDNRCHERIDLHPSIADGLLGTLTPLTYDISHGLVESVKLVEEDEIINAMRVFQLDEQLMIEGSASVGLAAILSGKIEVQGQKVVLILTGRNIDAGRYNQLINEKKQDV